VCDELFSLLMVNTEKWGSKL